MLFVMGPAQKKFTNKASKFIVYLNEDIRAKHLAGKNVNTTKTEEDHVFSRFLKQCGETNLDYWFYEEPKLDSFLSNFWFGARKDPDSDYETDSDNSEGKICKYYAKFLVFAQQNPEE